MRPRQPSAQQQGYGPAFFCALTMSVCALAAGEALGQGADAGMSDPQAANAAPALHMTEALRTSLQKVVVVATRSQADEAVSGTYEKGTPGLMGGVAAGSRLGRFSKQVGPVPIVIPIPILTIPGAIFGGLSGAAKREIQEFRDALAEELIEAESPTLTDDGLALDVFWGIRKLPSLDSKIVAPVAEIPADTDAVLHVMFSGLEIDIQGKEAIITTSGLASLQRYGDGAKLYETEIRYQDRDLLSNWTANDNALWRDYVNFARYYLGRELVADVFGQIDVKHTLSVAKTESLKVSRKNPHEFTSREMAPTLAWELAFAESSADGGWQAPFAAADISYDLEIYDQHEPVYVAESLDEPRHTLTMDLEPCKTYRWSVRPIYRDGNDLRYGEWLRLAPLDKPGKKQKKFRNKAEQEKAAVGPAQKGLVGRQASTAPAYTQDFPLLTIDCGRR
ncbi:MAG: hypothetical protein WBM54_02520 [Woeseia sp.]